MITPLVQPVAFPPPVRAGFDVEREIRERSIRHLCAPHDKQELKLSVGDACDIQISDRLYMAIMMIVNSAAPQIIVWTAPAPGSALRDRMIASVPDRKSGTGFAIMNQ